MNRYLRNFFYILVVFLWFLPERTIAQDSELQFYKLSRVAKIIDSYYVDNADSEALVKAAIVAMLKELDPHSVYLSKEDVARLNAPLEGNFEGIGVSFNILNDTIFIKL